MSQIHVYPSGKLFFHGKEYACVLGREGVKKEKKEGDGATPAGRFPVREIFFRDDRVKPPKTEFPLRTISPDDGWCDDPGDEKYNRWVKIPHSARHEHMWRRDCLYDIAVVLGYNDDPPIAGKGSAIFMHRASPEFGHTEGCIALSLPDLTEIVESIDLSTEIVIHEQEISEPD